MVRLEVHLHLVKLNRYLHISIPKRIFALLFIIIIIFIQFFYFLLIWETLMKFSSVQNFEPLRLVFVGIMTCMGNGNSMDFTSRLVSLVAGFCELHGLGKCMGLASYLVLQTV